MENQELRDRDFVVVEAVIEDPELDELRREADAVARRLPPERFRELDLEVHSFLADVPLHDVTAIDLPGGGPERQLTDVRALLSRGVVESSGGWVKFLFALRTGVGRLLGWDRETYSHPEESYLPRLTTQQRERSLVAPGTADGPFRILYLFPREALSEIRNATVHAFSCMALEPTDGGQRLYWGIYVKPVSRFTSVYMALIEPFRRFIVYPTILRRLRNAWIAAYG
jgi:hypothetical protein